MSKVLQLSVCEWWRVFFVWKKKVFVQANVSVTCLGSFMLPLRTKAAAYFSNVLHVGMDVKRCVYQKETVLVSRTSASPSLPSTVATALVLGQTVLGNLGLNKNNKCVTSVFV